MCLILGSLGHFLYTARSCSIPMVWERSSVSIPDQLARFGMTAKKSHEVANFAEYIFQLVSQENINQVIKLVALIPCITSTKLVLLIPQ